MSKAMLATTKGTNLIAKGKKQHKQEMGQKRRDNTSKKWGKEGGTMHDKSKHMRLRMGKG